MEPLDRETRQEIVQVIYKFRSELYRNEDLLSYHRKRIIAYRKVNNAEMAEAHEADMTDRQKIVDFLRAEIRLMLDTLRRGRGAA